MDGKIQILKVLTLSECIDFMNYNKIFLRVFPRTSTNVKITMERPKSRIAKLFPERGWGKRETVEENVFYQVLLQQMPVIKTVTGM